jgi:hypothetical protein
MLQVEISEPDDIQDVELYSQAGEDYNPPLESAVYIEQAGEAYKIVVASDDGIVPTSNPGERQLYSSAGGSKLANIYIKVDGSVEINFGTDSAIAFSRMKTAFDQLKTDFDALVSLYNAHIHITTATVGAGPTPGVISPTTSTGSPSTADMTAAESPTIKVP